LSEVVRGAAPPPGQHLSSDSQDPSGKRALWVSRFPGLPKASRLRIPGDVDNHSELMSITIPDWCR